MLWEECEVNSNKYHCEVDFCPCAVEGIAREEGKPVDKAGHNCKDSAYREDIVEVCYYIVGVV